MTTTWTLYLPPAPSEIAALRPPPIATVSALARLPNLIDDHVAPGDVEVSWIGGPHDPSLRAECAERCLQDLLQILATHGGSDRDKTAAVRSRLDRLWPELWNHIRVSFTSDLPPGAIAERAAAVDLPQPVPTPHWPPDLSRGAAPHR